MERLELRCPSTLHGIMTEHDLLEVKCGRRACGAGSGVVVLHTINITTGQVVGTKRFSDPVREGRNVNGTR